MKNEIKEMQELIKRNIRGCLPMIESAFVENNCLCGNCAECKALLLASGDMARNLYNAGYRKQSDTIKEFAEKLEKELFAKCVVIQTISNPQKEDMDSSEAFQIIKDLAEQYGKEE